MMGLADTEDFWEGPKAFLEKRDPSGRAAEGRTSGRSTPRSGSGPRATIPSSPAGWRPSASSWSTPSASSPVDRGARRRGRQRQRRHRGRPPGCAGHRHRPDPGPDRAGPRPGARTSASSVDLRVGNAERARGARRQLRRVMSVMGVIFAPGCTSGLVAEMARATRPGGTVALTAWAEDGWSTRWRARAAELLPDRRRAVPSPTPGATPTSWPGDWPAPAWPRPSRSGRSAGTSTPSRRRSTPS